RARPRIAERLVLERHDAIEVVGCGEAKVYAIAGIETRILRKLDGRPHAVTLRSTCGHGFLPTAAGPRRVDRSRAPTRRGRRASPPAAWRLTGRRRARAERDAVPDPDRRC